MPHQTKKHGFRRAAQKLLAKPTNLNGGMTETDRTIIA